MIVRKVAALVLSGLLVANCATAPGEEGFCSRNTALCVAGGAVVVALAAIVVVGRSSGDNGGIGLASDLRLKKDVRSVGVLPNGIQLYSFQYWNDERTFVGVIAQDLLEDKRFRHAVTEDESGYYKVNLGALGLDITGSRKQFIEASRKAVAKADPVRN